jgi:hypothetical protein
VGATQSSSSACFRELKPRRILEIGSGHASALILDTNERYFGGSIDCTFVEPHPELLISLLRPKEDHEPRLISRKLQDVNLTLFDTLEAGDILFVDSSHVVKAGSDCQLLFSDILPRLNPGTLIHFHDVSIDSSIRPSGYAKVGDGTNNMHFAHFSSSTVSFGSNFIPRI